VNAGEPRAAEDADRIAAILLAGGRGSRMGGVDKPRLVVDGVSLLDRAARAVRGAGADPIVAVGPASPPGSRVTEDAVSDAVAVQWVREDPPYSGPAAAIVAALAAMPPDADPDWTFVLACDLPRVDGAVQQLVADIPLLPAGTDGACLADTSGRPQWLTGVYRVAALRRSATSLPDEGRDQSMRALLSDLAIAVLADRSGGAADIDTWEDYRRFTKESP
jgi:molybdopterin-guanine dinucleotide biosynthesis protein A